jgi:uncharacterized protein (DUF488 family)
VHSEPEPQPSSSAADALTIWTVGHSTRAIDAFAAALAPYEIEAVADVRRFPGSRRLPQFAAPALRASLEERGVSYVWIPALGGRRRALPASVNVAWRHEAFRGYADHLASEEFADGLFELLMVARGLRTAIMCAEVLWWRCHRRLIADVLTALGVQVVHIREERSSTIHAIAPPARLVNGVLRYDATVP